MQIILIGPIHMQIIFMLDRWRYGGRGGPESLTPVETNPPF